ncbi:MAG TPA: aminotransferase class I/II-fold pyridoxal phosphate-dependent enzyme [Candidatus Polarisedimenticolia bacterium]|nr:aminotransferase class I/II-fold pyridoxal phosphate-dependent enzyme [Candidatus Polarisedimenticolia bacterium]
MSTLPLASRLRGVERTVIRQIFDAAPAGAINFGLGQPDLPTPDVVKKAGIEAILRDRTRYTVTAGDADLREAIAARYPGFAEGPDSVVVTIGTGEAVFLACSALLEPGDDVLVPDPGFPTYATTARILGARPIGYPLRPENGFGLDPEDVARCLTPATRLVVLNSPGNPTGGVDTGEALDRVAALAEQRGFVWMSDEIYSSFLYEGTFESLSTRSRRGVVVSGLSKEASMAGWRAGWLAAEPAFAHACTAMHQYVATCAPSISQRAALAALSPEGREAAATIVQRFRRRRDRALEILAGARRARVPRPAGAFYLFADVSAVGDSMTVCQELMHRGVITIPGSAFGSRGEGWLRISYAAPEDDLERGMAIVRDVLS